MGGVLDGSCSALASRCFLVIPLEPEEASGCELLSLIGMTGGGGEKGYFPDRVLGTSDEVQFGTGKYL